MFDNSRWSYNFFVVLAFLLFTLLQHQHHGIAQAEEITLDNEDLQNDESIDLTLQSDMRIPILANHPQRQESDLKIKYDPEGERQLDAGENDAVNSEEQPYIELQENQPKATDVAAFLQPVDRLLYKYTRHGDEQNEEQENTPSVATNPRRQDDDNGDYAVNEKLLFYSISPIGNRSTGQNDHKTSYKKQAIVSNFEKHKSHHRNNKRYGHRTHKKTYSKYKKKLAAHLRTIAGGVEDKNNNFYQGQVSYYGTDIDSVADNSPTTYHSRHSAVGKTRSGQHRYHHHHHHGNSHGRTNSHSHHLNQAEEYHHSSVKNSKWPHLSRVQYQLYQDEKLDEDADLPPYIKKYKRRNKQLLNLLEGTLPPPSQAPPIDDGFQLPLDSIERDRNTQAAIKSHKSYKKHQHHYHNRKKSKFLIEDLFEEQRANPNNPNRNMDEYQDDFASVTTTSTSAPPLLRSAIGSFDNEKNFRSDNSRNFELNLIAQNELPGDSVDLSEETLNPSFTIAKNDLHEDGKKDLKNVTVLPVEVRVDGKPVSPTMPLSYHPDEERLKVSPKANKFAYHRVASPRIVGSGGSPLTGGKKQRLPFVAITDRRLETAKMRQQKEELLQHEQQRLENHLPLP